MSKNLGKSNQTFLPKNKLIFHQSNNCDFINFGRTFVNRSKINKNVETQKTQISALKRVKADLFTLKISTGHFARLRFGRNLSIFAEEVQQNYEINFKSKLVQNSFAFCNLLLK